MKYNKIDHIIKESINKVLHENNLSNERNKYIKKLYKFTDKFTHSLYKDDNWSNVSKIIENIKNFIGQNGTLTCQVKNGGYWKSITEFPNYKEYLLTIELENGIEINGSLKCHAAGTINDVFAKYDITITFW